MWDPPLLVLSLRLPPQHADQLTGWLTQALGVFDLPMRTLSCRRLQARSMLASGCTDLEGTTTGWSKAAPPRTLVRTWMARGGAGPRAPARRSGCGECARGQAAVARLGSALRASSRRSGAVEALLRQALARRASGGGAAVASAYVVCCCACQCLDSHTEAAGGRRTEPASDGPAGGANPTVAQS